MLSGNQINALLLVGAVGTSLLFTAFVSSEVSTAGSHSEAAVVDATGNQVAVRDYTRIVSTSTIADQVLVEIIDPRRLLAVSAHTVRTQGNPVYESKIGVERARDIETIIELRPDIVFVNNFVDRRYVARFKEAGLNVFDLGEMRGLRTLSSNVRHLARVLDVPDRGERLLNELLGNLGEVAADIPEGRRRRGLYVGIYGDRLFGGTEGTSFHDILRAGGLIDVAAQSGYRGWPTYTNEQLLTLDPPWIITNPGTEEALCSHPGLQALEACRLDQVRSIDTNLLTDPGLGMLEAARAVRAAVYGEVGEIHLVE